MPAGTMYKTKKQQNSTIKAIARAEAKKVVLKEADKKHHYVYDVGVNVNDTTSAPIWPLAYVPEGTGPEQRTGEWINPLYLRVRGEWAVGDVYNSCRLIIFQYKDDGNAPTAGTILKYAGYSYAPYSPFLDAYKNSYNVLYDKTVIVDSDGPKSKQFDIKLKAKKFRKIQLNADPIYRSGGIFMLAISDSGVADHPSITFTSMLLYTDE